MITSLKPGPSVQLQEYSVTDGTGKITQPVQRDELDAEVVAEGTNS